MPCVQLALLGALSKAMSGSYIHMTVRLMEGVGNV